MKDAGLSDRDMLNRLEATGQVFDLAFVLVVAELAVMFLMVLFPPLVTVPAKWFGG